MEYAVAGKMPASVLVGFKVQATCSQVEALDVLVGPAQRYSFPRAEFNPALVDDERRACLPAIRATVRAIAIARLRPNSALPVTRKAQRSAIQEFPITEKELMRNDQIST